MKWIENYSMAYQISNILAFLFSCDACTHNNDKWAIYYCIILHNTIYSIVLHDTIYIILYNIVSHDTLQ